MKLHNKVPQGGKKEAAWCKDPMDKKGKKTRKTARMKAAMRSELKMHRKQYEVLVRMKRRKRRQFIDEEASLWGPAYTPKPLTKR